MTQTIEVLNRMERDKIIGRYAIAGAVAAIYYVEVTSTEDLDILVSFDTMNTGQTSGLVLLTPIIAYLAAQGYDEFRHEGVVVEGWPVQFLPVASQLDEEALEQANDIELLVPNEPRPVVTRVLRAEHLVAKAVELQRPTDMIRISQFIELEKVDLSLLAGILNRYQLRGRWIRYCQVTGRPDPLHGRLDG